MQQHVPVAGLWLDKAHEKMTDATPSGVDPQEVVTWLEEQKKECHPIDMDVRDAKRRINAAKGPQKGRKRKAAEDVDEESSGAGSD